MSELSKGMVGRWLSVGRRRLLGAVPLLVASVAACGQSVPAISPDRASGQSGLMSGTFAGANACNPKSHDRPFVIEWDGTDMSMFESVAAYDMVFVSYRGCELKVVDTCRNDSQKGQLGAYRPIEWTSGSVEKVDVRNEGELYAKLPLGAATLGARVKAGESFLMEYFVAGTRTATRAEVHRGDLASRPGCKDVTHFVYAYNLGAFALGSRKALGTEGTATFAGVGTGGSTTSQQSAEKKGGSLSTCRSESAQEVSGCKTPIRLVLRSVEDGQGTGALAAAAPETPDAKNLAGKIQREREASTSAEAHLRAAEEKDLAKDPTGALAEYDAYDQLEPDATKHSSNPASKWSQPRAHLLMKVGKCDAGRELYRKSLEKMGFAPAIVDSQTSDTVARSCTGSKGISPREELVRATEVLYAGNYGQRSVSAKECSAAFATAKRLEGQVHWQGDSEPNVLMLPRTLADYGPGCLVKANDCPAAYAIYKERSTRRGTEAELRAAFEAKHASCRGK